MDLKTIEENLNEKTGSKYNFKFKNAELDKSSGVCLVSLFYKDGTILDENNRAQVSGILIDLLPSGFDYKFNFIKNFVVNEAVQGFVAKYLSFNLPSIKFDIKSVDCESQVKTIKLSASREHETYILGREIKAHLEQTLKEEFSADIVCQIDFEEKQLLQDISLTDEETFVFEEVVQNRFIEVADVVPLVGALSDSQAYYIKDKQNAEQNVVLCGRVVFIKEFSYVPKKAKKDDEQKDASENPIEEVKERKFFKFMIEDFTGKMSCVFFSNKNNYEQMLELNPQESIIVGGDLEEDKFSGGVSLKVKSISRCTLPEQFKEEIAFKSEPKNYETVFPSDYEYYAQADLFNMQKQEEVPEILANQDYVVFDFETTGFEASSGDKIIEIGAVKMQGGKLTQTFSSMVNPERNIPAKVTELTGISAKDVKDAPLYDKVLKDFYKFTRNCVLVGYNVAFDYSFLNTYGRKCGYNFDNRLLDVYKLALKSVKGTKNYKLGTIAEKLNVSLDNAHRAVHDAIATAEVFIKLAGFVDDKCYL